MSARPPPRKTVVKIAALWYNRSEKTSGGGYVFTRDGAGSGRPGGHRICDRGSVRRSPFLRPRHRVPPFGERGAEGRHAPPAAVRRRLSALRRAENGLFRVGRRGGQHGQQLHGGQKAPHAGRVQRGRRSGQASRPLRGRVLQKFKAAVPRRSRCGGRHRGVPAPLCPLRLLGGQSSAEHPALVGGGSSDVRHGRTPRPRDRPRAEKGDPAGKIARRPRHLLPCKVGGSLQKTARADRERRGGVLPLV